MYGELLHNYLNTAVMAVLFGEGHETDSDVMLGLRTKNGLSLLHGGLWFQAFESALNKNYYHKFSFFLEIYTYSIRNNPKYAKLYHIEKYLTLVMALGEIWVCNKAYVSYFARNRDFCYGYCSNVTDLEILAWRVGWRDLVPPCSVCITFSVLHRQKFRFILTHFNYFFESCRLPTKKCPNFTIIYEKVNNF